MGFKYTHTVHILDTNIEGNVYFTRFFEWQGITREEYLKSKLTPEQSVAFWSSGIRLITVDAFVEYINEARLFDQIEIEMTTKNIKKASLEMWFAYKNKLNGQLLAKGKQTLTFRNKNNKIIPIPDFILKIAKEIQEEPKAKITARTKI
ncbi:MAG: thioesterase family protein [Candidatus Omnitrophica bacterium]|nr:thioesterase family protein [Candidatus Omnitrophota bacterium]